MNERQQFLTLKSPTKVYYDVAFACNLKCAFCYVNWNQLASLGELSTPSVEHVERILAALREAEVLDIIALGGDLFSYEHYKDFIRLASGMGFGVGVISNATQVTDRIAKELAPYVNSCGVSFRGASPQEFDAATQVRGSFGATVRGLRCLVDAGICVSLLYDPLPQNLGTLYETVRMLVQDHNLPIAGIQLNRIIPAGRALAKWEQIALAPEDYYELFRQLLSVRESFGIRVELGDAFPFCRVPPAYWPLLSRCEYGVLWGAITSRGEIKRCSISARALGNIVEQSLTEIWQFNQELVDYRALKWAGNECARCSLLAECAGACAISVPGALHEQPDNWQPQALNDSPATRMERIRRSTDCSARSDLPVWRPNERPKLAVRPRFRQEAWGILCVPESTPLIIEQSECPWLTVDDLEKEIMLLCDGQKSLAEIIDCVMNQNPTVVPDEVIDLIAQLDACRYLVPRVECAVKREDTLSSDVWRTLRQQQDRSAVCHNGMPCSMPHVA